MRALDLLHPSPHVTESSDDVFGSPPTDDRPNLIERLFRRTAHGARDIGRAAGNRAFSWLDARRDRIDAS